MFCGWALVGLPQECECSLILRAFFVKLGIYCASICGIISKGKEVWITDRRGRLKCDGTRGVTRVRLSAKRTSLFKSAWASFLSTAGSRGVRISGSNAGYNILRGSVKGKGYPVHLHSFPFISPLVHHRVTSHFNCSLPHSSLVKIPKRSGPQKNKKNNNNKALQCEAWSLSGGDHCWFKRSTGKKCLWKGSSV